ncbi:MAG: HEAT repeat domain-containing protein [Myxococcales bacterium]|nr:HEAT repeat domain-containing protein [Myxococcales bacterium]
MSGARAAPSNWHDGVELLLGVSRLPLGERCQAVERLAHSTSPWIRDRALHIGATILPDARLVALLREEADDIGRNIGLEMLKRRGGRALAVALPLLTDREADVVLQAVLVLDASRDPRAVEPLRATLRHPDPNVVQAAIVALGHVGDGRVVDDLVPYLGAGTWLRVAAVQALGDLRSRKALRRLARLLDDPEVGPLVAESMARIGGRVALATLARHWLRQRDAGAGDALLGLLAHVAEGLEQRPPPLAAAEAAARAHLDGCSAATRQAAARLLLALGAARAGDPALGVAGVCDDLPAEPPPSLSRRVDLLGDLLRSSRPLYGWGLRVALRNAARVERGDLDAAMASPHAADGLPHLVRLLLRARRGPSVEGLLDLHGRLSAPDRARLVPVLRRHRAAVRPWLAARAATLGPRGLVLRAVLGRASSVLGAALARLEPEWLHELVDHVRAAPAVLQVVPWQRLLADDVERYGAVVARAALSTRLPELAGAVREAARRSAAPALVRALGELGGPESAAVLVELLSAASALTRALVIDALGRLGGDEGRATLLRLLPTLAPAERPIGHHALERCCRAEDRDLFRCAAHDGDWQVRLAAAEALGRLRGEGSHVALLHLASDAVPAVAERAAALLEE